MLKRRSTLMDIAKITGVSAMTVSKALNDQKGVSPATKQRILEAAQQLNYTPNLVARSLRTDSTRSIGVVLADTNEMAAFSLLDGIGMAADQHDYSLLLASVGRSAKKEEKAIQMLLSKRIEGLILVASIGQPAETIESVKRFGVPVLILMRRSTNGEADCLVNDNENGAYILMRHLLDTGSREIAILRIAQPSQAGDERVCGCLRALNAYGVSSNRFFIHSCEPDIQSGYSAARELLEKGRPFDTLVCGCDLIAIGAINALRDAGIAVPDRVRVSGYDDLEIARYTAVPLTTIRQPFKDMGQRGFEILYERIQNNDTGAPFRCTLVEGMLVLRESTEIGPL